MSWVVFYPKTKPPLPDGDMEFGVVSSVLPSDTITGVDLTLARASNFFANNRGATGVWVIAHSGADGVYLSDGLVSAEQIAEWIHAAGIREVVLNSCENLAVARRIHELTNATVLATWTPSGKGLDDAFAYGLARRLAEHLAAGARLGDAWRAAKPLANNDYILLEGNQRVKASVINEIGANGETLRILRIEVRLESLEEEQSRLARGVERNRDDITEVKMALGGMTIRLEKNEPRSTSGIGTIALFLVGGIAVLSLVATVLVILMSSGG